MEGGRKIGENVKKRPALDAGAFFGFSKIRAKRHRRQVLAARWRLRSCAKRPELIIYFPIISLFLYERRSGPIIFLCGSTFFRRLNAFLGGR